MPITIPLEVWSLIESYVLPNPYSYTDWSHVCRGSRAIFHSDAVWAKFTPVELQGNYADNFYRRMSNLGEPLREKFRMVWRELEQAQTLDSTEEENDDVHVRNLLFRSQYFEAEVFESPDLWLAGKCWGHMMCYSWLTPQIFADRESHARFVRNMGVKSRALSLAAVRLYGVQLRYLDEHDLDDEEFVLAAARSHFTLSDSDNSTWLQNWRHVPPYNLISERLKLDPQISLAFVSRWPSLASDLPQSLKSDPLFRPYIACT